MTKEEFKKLFDSYFDEIRRYLLYRSGNAEVATDIAQDTFTRVWEKRLKIEKENSKRLLFKIANDLFISKYRRDKLEFEFFKHYKFEGKGHSPEDILRYRQLKDNYEKALSNMPEKQRTVFLMHRAEDLKYREIAERAGISIKAVEKRMKKALEFLRVNLGNHAQ